MDPSASDERVRIDSALAQVRALRAAAPAALPEIRGYELERELHRGGQGVVYRARQRSTGRTVALKLLREELAGASARPRFEREVAVLSALEHPALVRILDCGLHEGRFFYVMEFVAGADLDVELRERPRDLRERVALLARVAHAVAAAHQRGVLHRDLKPSNVRIDERGEPRLVDFGLARWLRGEDPAARTLTEAGDFVGSAPWASPEQVSGEPIDARSDVYSLGVVAYQALTGRFPYAVDGPLARTFESIRAARPLDARRACAEVDRDLATILARALEKEPERRYPAALDLARDFENWLGGRPIEARRATPLYVAWKAVRRRPLASVASLGAIVALVAAVLVLFRQRGELREAVVRLEGRLHAERLRRLEEALESGDGVRLGALLAQVPAERRDWLVRHHEERLAARQVLFETPGERPLALAFAPDGATLALGTWQGVVRLLTRADGGERWRNDTDLSAVRALEFSADGALVLALESRALVFLRAADGGRERSFEWPEGGLEALSTHAGRIVLATQAGTVVSFAAGAEEAPAVLRLRHEEGRSADDGGSKSGIDFTAVSAAAGRAATVGGNELVLWELASGTALAREPLQAFAGRAVGALSFSADGTRLALSFPPLSARAATLWVIDARDGRRLHSLENLATTPDLALVQSHVCWAGGLEGELREIELATGRIRQVLPGSGRKLDAARLSPGGDELYLLAGRLERVELEPAPAAVVARRAGTDPIEARDGTRVARAEGASLWIEDPARALETTVALPEPGEIGALCWLGDEDLLAVGTDEGDVWFVDGNGDILATRSGPGRSIVSLSYQAEERALLVMDVLGRELVWRSRAP